ncbi:MULTISPECIES: hypothetical protein [unclassified Inquilinus]|uniref:hypothetical protein n=1 Tax=unclassified Inquilinus TaxID=2645927 RepID=UPI003F935846
MSHDLTNDADWQDLVERFGGAEALTRSAREHKAFQRARGVKDAATLLRLALMYGPGGLSLRGAAGAAALGGIAALSDVALLGRLRAAGRCGCIWPMTCPKSGSATASSPIWPARRS